MPKTTKRRSLTASVADSEISPLQKKNRAEIELLFWRGYLPQYRNASQALRLIDQPTLDRAMEEFETLTGRRAKSDNMEVRFCLLPDKAPLRATICKWPKLDVTWCTVGGLGSLSENDVRQSYWQATAWWNEICAIRLRYNANSKTADIVARAANLGGPGNVLADSGLPCGSNPRQQPQRYDGENWVISETPAPGQIDLTRVQCHELGHAIGSDHIAMGNLLAPMYNPAIRKPQAGDIAEMQARYPGAGSATPPLPGGTDPPPTIPPPLPPGGSASVAIKITTSPGVTVDVEGYRKLPL